LAIAIFLIASYPRVDWVTALKRLKTGQPDLKTPIGRLVIAYCDDKIALLVAK
jgi:hypothetical protein